jgi:hypothetical protein
MEEESSASCSKALLLLRLQSSHINSRGKNMIQPSVERSPRTRVALFLGFASVAIVSVAASSSSRVAGRLVDISCYSQDKNDTGNHHARKGMTCAQACAREGFEVGLLTPDGKLYHIRGGLSTKSNAKLIPYMSQNVTITGVFSEMNGQKMISAEDLEETR